MRQLRDEGKSYTKILEIISDEFKNENFTIYKIKKQVKTEL